jgi:cytochrome c oxidase assembly protein subunit 15
MLEHRFAKLAAGATFLLLIIGGIVNATGSGLACPEAVVVCHGQIFPKLTAFDGVLYEHGHRLAAMTVGCLQIALTVFLIKRRPELTKLAWLLLAMVVAQGGLGAVTVALKLPWWVATLHLLLAMSYFATLIYTAFLTRPAPSVVELQRHDKLRAELGSARTWIAAAVGVVFVQLILGALVRHTNAATACLGIPACTPQGEWWPNETMQQGIQMVHRGFGIVVAIVTTTSAVMVLRRAKSWASLRVLALIAPLLVLGQIALGIFTVLTIRAVPLAVGHFAGAECLWTLWMSALLMTGPRLGGGSSYVELVPP